MGGARLGLAWAAGLALAGCGGGLVPPRSAGSVPVQSPRAAQPGQASHGVLGADARALTRLFGEPRLDIRDPAARKLQFSDGRCILDAYLYVQQARKEPVVTYAEARRSDGTQMDWVACATQLRAR